MSIRLPSTLLLALAAALTLAGCGSVKNPSLPTGTAAYEVIPEASVDRPIPDYQIQPGDVLSITVFQEPDLSFPEMRVDASGNLVFPLIGQVRAAGRSAIEVAEEIASRLNEDFLVNPQVSLFITDSSAQVVTVEGSVTQPGVFPLFGSSNLLQTMALARGPTSTAKLDEIIVFRPRGNEVYAAQFDLAQVRVGLQPNPEILAGDIVIVGNSAVKGFFQELLRSGPALAAVFVRVI